MVSKFYAPPKHICLFNQRYHPSIYTNEPMPNYTYVQGLCLPVLGQKLSFPKFEWASGYAGYAYFQILYTISKLVSNFLYITLLQKLLRKM